MPVAAVQPPDLHWVAVGVVRGPFGVHGAMKVEPFSDVESSVLNKIRRWRMDAPTPGGAAASKKASSQQGSRQPLAFQLPAEVMVESVRQHGEFIIATIAPAVSREQVLALKGAEVLVDRNDFPAPDADEYYWADLIGCQVFDPAGSLLGTVEALDDHGAQSVLRLDNRILIPFVAACILEVATQQKRIVADWSVDWLQ